MFNEQKRILCYVLLGLSGLPEIHRDIRKYIYSLIECPHFCECINKNVCCICSDLRDTSPYYHYSDGRTYKAIGRNEHYCPTCKNNYKYIHIYENNVQQRPKIKYRNTYKLVGKAKYKL